MVNTHDFIRKFPARFRMAFVAVRNNRTARVVFRVAAGSFLVPVAFAVFTAFYVNFNRTNLPDLDGFIRFEPPTEGHVYDANGHVRIELGRERRDIMRYEQIPVVVRDAVLSAEDQNFFSHSGVDYSVFLRLLAKTNIRALAAHFTTFDGRNTLPSVHSCFRKAARRSPSSSCAATSSKNFPAQKTANRSSTTGISPRVLAFVIGVPGTNKLLLKIETIRLSLWIESEMQKQYGSKRRAKEELFARYANFVYLGNGRYGFAAASDFYFHKPIETFTVDDADKAALLAAIPKSPGDIRSYRGRPSKTHAPEK